MTIFYKDKNYREQYEKARFNGATRQEARSQAELITLGIYAAMAALVLAAAIFFLIAIYILVVFVNSPGIGVVELLKSYAGLEIGRTASWLLSLSMSISILSVMYIGFRSRHKILGPVIYAVLCLVVSVSLINVEDGFGRNVGVKFLISYAPQETINKGIAKVFGLDANNDDVNKTSTPVVSAESNRVNESSIVGMGVSVNGDAVDKGVVSSLDKKLNVDSKLTQVSEPERQLEVYSTSYDCNSAKYNSEKIVCSNYELAVFDNAIAEKYRALRALSQDDPNLKSSQIAWIKSVRLCENAECIKLLYENRLLELESYQSLK